MKYLYKYPQARYPYEWLLEENRKRGGRGFEFELLDTGVFDEDRYFDVFVEYGKASAEDVCVRIEAVNRGPDAGSPAYPPASLVPQYAGDGPILAARRRYRRWARGRGCHQPAGG